MTTPTRITDDSVAAVRQFSPIADIVGYLVDLGEPAPNGSRRGRCPFCDDGPEPSFSVGTDRGLWYCFSCGEGGDVIKYVQKTEDVDFAEAVELLAAEVGLTVAYEPNQHLIAARAIAHLDWPAP